MENLDKWWDVLYSVLFCVVWGAKQNQNDWNKDMNGRMMWCDSDPIYIPTINRKSIIFHCAAHLWTNISVRLLYSFGTIVFYLFLLDSIMDIRANTTKYDPPASKGITLHRPAGNIRNNDSILITFAGRFMISRCGCNNIQLTAICMCLASAIRTIRYSFCIMVCSVLCVVLWA